VGLPEESLLIIQTAQKQKSTIKSNNANFFTRYYLFLIAGYSEELEKEVTIPQGLEDEEEKEQITMRKSKYMKRNKRGQRDRSDFKSRDWVLKKKERQRRQVKFNFT
jgi:hypothetical protein